MRTLLATVVSLLVSWNALGQGAIYLNNRVAGVVEARVLLPDGSGAGAGWSAQLYAAMEGAAVAELQPLTPITSFRTSSTATQGFVEPVDVVVPGVQPGERAMVVLRAFNGSSYERSTLRGESLPIAIALGGGTLPPANLYGLQGFAVGQNPNLVTLAATGGANGAVIPASVTRIKGESQSFVAIPNANYTVDQWWVDGTVAQDGGVTFTLANIQASHSIAVTFKTVANGGAVSFNNYVVGAVDARVIHPNGTGVGEGWVAQLYGGPEGTALSSLLPLFPQTTFRTGSGAVNGYVNPVQVTVPGVQPGSRATLVMRAFQGATFESSVFHGESALFTITVGGGIQPPANLNGLQGFTVNGPVITITASAGANGAISPSGAVSKFQGESETFVAIPNANYVVDQWTVNGAVVQTGGLTYTLANIQASASVSVTFKLASLDGSVIFSNYIPDAVDARILLANGTGAGAGWTAQLYGGPEGTATADLKRLHPTTTFRTTSEATLGYVNAVDVSVPAVAPGAKATLVMRVYNGVTFETSSARGESAPITVVLGGGMLPPANLTGLQGFTLPTEPPPPPTAGLVTFNNYVPGLVDARVRMPDGSGVGAGWTAQLYGGPVGGTLTPLHPTTTFRARHITTSGYVEPVVVAIPNVRPGAKATIVMTAYLGSSFESAALFGQSKPITVTAGGNTLPPANLIGLESFVIVSRLPVILKQPVSQTAFVGGNVIFSVEAIGREPLSYQWSFNGRAIARATSSVLAIPNIQQSHAGIYTVMIGNVAGTVTSAAASLTVLSGTPAGDFNNDGFTDLLFQNDDGFLAVWFMKGASLQSASLLTPNHVRDSDWRIVGSGHFNSDAHEDILFQHKEGPLAVWFMEGTKLASAQFLDPIGPKDDDWRVVATSDFNRDGQVDLLFQHDDGTLAVWYMNGVKLASGELLNPSNPRDHDWRVAGVADLNADGRLDLVFQHKDGTLAYWFLDGVTLIKSGLLDPPHPRDKDWRVESVADLDGDGKSDLVFQHEDGGTLAVWFMDGIKLKGAELLRPPRPGGSWEPVAP